jgi:hypothetical protein
VKIKSLFVGFICIFTVNVYAGTTDGKVGSVFVHAFNDVFAFGMVSTNPVFASCAASKRYAVSTSTQQGKNLLSTILAAKAAGQTIQVVGKGTCTANGDSEDINYVAVY